MNTESIGYVRGYDLFFLGATEETLQSISKSLSNTATYSMEKGCVTYMAKQAYEFQFTNQLGGIHENARKIGESFAIQHCCVYLYSELYIRTNETGFITMQQQLGTNL